MKRIKGIVCYFNDKLYFFIQKMTVEKKRTGIASARDPLRMAAAMRDACSAGRQAYLAGRIPRRLYANASSPNEGLIADCEPRPVQRSGGASS